MFGNYNKLAGSIIGSIVGYVVALAFLWMAYRGWAVCTAVDNVETCTVWGFTYSQVATAVAGVVTAILSAVFVERFPKNVPPAVIAFIVIAATAIVMWQMATGPGSVSFRAVAEAPLLRLA